MKLLKYLNIRIMPIMFGCDGFYECSEVQKPLSFGNDVGFGTYYTFDDFTFHRNDDAQWKTINAKKILVLQKDSAFTEYVTDSLGDTIVVEKGKYSIHKANSQYGKENVYSFELNVDTVQKKWEWNKNEELKILDAFKIEVKSFVSNDGSTFLIDIQKDDTCFTLGRVYQDDMCREYFYEGTKRYCSNAVYRDSSIVNAKSVILN